MFHPLPTPEEMAAWDRQAMDEYGIRPEMLMENAARAAVDALLMEIDLASLRGQSILVFCGPGNNGGDGFAIARRLQDLGTNSVVVHTKPKKKYRGEARYHLDLARRVDVPMFHLPRFDFANFPTPAVVIDALLGTGFSGMLKPEMLNLVEQINSLNSYVMAVDCPTGLDAESGSPLPEAVRADMTATMHAVKLGMALPHAGVYTGRVRTCEIGIPMQVSARSKPAHHLIGPEIMNLVPLPGADMHKGSAGHVLVVGGSKGLTGAAHLAGMAALRGGAGLVTVACPAGLAEQVKHGCPDLMTLGLGSGEQWTQAMAKILRNDIERFDSVVIGPGLGRTTEAGEFLAALLPGLTLPCVLDADALYHLATLQELTPRQAILTPHPGEMGRFLGVNSKQVQSTRFQAACDLAENTGATVVLKGSGTIVASPDGASYLCSISAPNLAVAGSGDVLSGLLGSLLGRCIAPLPGACLGVYWHGLVGKTLAKDFPGRGNLASEIAHALPAALKECIC